MEESENRVRISGDVRGQVVVGDHNIVVSAEQSVVTILTPAQRPECRRRDDPQLLPRRHRTAVGREQELAAIEAGMDAGGPMQVYGPPGTGKSTVLRMAAHRLSGRRDGVVFVDAASRETGDVLQDVFEACYDAPGYRPGAIELRRLMADVGISLVLDDLECSSDELDAVLDTVTAAAVLYSAARRSLWGEGPTLALGGLGCHEASTLLAQQLGRPLRADELSVAEELWRATAGSPGQLLRAVAGERLRPPAELGDLLPNVLAELTGADHEVLSLLDLAGAGGVSTGLLTALVAGAGVTAGSYERLVTLGLVVPTVLGLRISADVGATLSARLDLDTSALTALCQRLRRWVEEPDRAPADVAGDGALITAAIDAAARAGAAGAGAGLARAAAPVVACSLRLGVWGRVLELGRVAAERAHDNGVLAYLTHEQGIHRLVTGKRAAAATAFAAAAEIWRRLGDSGHAGTAEDAGSLCGPDAGPASQATGQESAAPHDPTAGQDAGATGDFGTELAQDPSGSLASTPVDPATATAAGAKGTTAVGVKSGLGLTAKVVIGGGLAVVTGVGVVLGQRAPTPETVPVRVTVTTRVVEVSMPAGKQDGCLIHDGSTDCSSVVMSKKGERGPIAVEPTGQLPEGASILYWGCDEGPEATSCTVRADSARTVCVSTTSAADRVARENCAEETGAPPPKVRTEAITVVAVDATGEARPGYTVVEQAGADNYVLGCLTSPAAKSPDIVYCAPNAATADVCWIKDDRSTVLCGDDPWKKRLLQYVVNDGPVPPVGPQTEPIPWAMELADGTRCRLRTGGAGPSLPDGMVAAYYCGDTGVLVAQGPRTPLLDTSAVGWTVQTMDEAAVSRGDDSIPPRTEVVKVYYAGRN
ncbi:ATP-binding protein [Streptomyces neyagawaensis]|uniref:ATP-binding protein n=1 Tax=Streptomyces neyagawaensis TaxID=42238 RepID=UPI0006E36517|nr:ATP-binding protein [Streptomyces neyagawaensis]MCL6737184.1 ATP-binding protein [Streptomyces neyagawaensis]MDE1686401.1 ATP-binding protein [Streptomyces neyagawaensis]